MPQTRTRQAELPAEPEIAKKPASERLVSLDAFRGATIALMVLVNTPGDGRHVYGPLQHADWNGWTITDVVFPSFLWIVGVSLTLSLAKRVAVGAPRRQLFLQVLRRAAILYALGLFLYGFPFFDLHTLRFLGVLQRIAICYAAAAGIYLLTGVRGQILWILGLLTAYGALMTLVPVPVYGPGDLNPDHNLANYVDQIVLGSHNYAGTKTWDPEGIISTLPAIATALFGVLAGQLLRIKRDLPERVAWMFLAGNLLLAAGLISNVWMPINKKLWTDSFSVFMAGLDFVMFAISLWVVDYLGYKRAVKPFVILGMNAITIYMISELLEVILTTIHWGSGASQMSLKALIYQIVFAPLGSPINASLLYAIAYVLVMFAIAYKMHKMEWFLRV
jgi:predicted acyltransferase